MHTASSGEEKGGEDGCREEEGCTEGMERGREGTMGGKKTIKEWSESNKSERIERGRRRRGRDEGRGRGEEG